MADLEPFRECVRITVESGWYAESRMFGTTTICTSFEGDVDWAGEPTLIDLFGKVFGDAMLSAMPRDWLARVLAHAIYCVQSTPDVELPRCLMLAAAEVLDYEPDEETNHDPN